jgi:AcrR family transcriptional regulator
VAITRPTSKEAEANGPRRAGRPRREGLDEQILDAAVAEMSRVGFVRMSMDAVASRAGTTKPTVYSRFQSKAKLAMSALEHMRRRTPREPLSGDVRQDLVHELTLFREGALRPYGMTMLGVVLAEEHETPELLALFRRHVIGPRRENLRRILRAGREAGQLDKDTDLELGITMMVGSLYSAYTAGRPPARDWPRKVVDAWLCANGTCRRK